MIDEVARVRRRCRARQGAVSGSSVLREYRLAYDACRAAQEAYERAVAGVLASFGIAPDEQIGVEQALYDAWTAARRVDATLGRALAGRVDAARRQAQPFPEAAG